jgi:hypothetical protein
VDRDIRFNMVDHFNKKIVTLPRHNARPRVLSIYSNHALRVAQACYILQYDLQNKKWKKESIEIILVQIKVIHAWDRSSHVR